MSKSPKKSIQNPNPTRWLIIAGALILLALLVWALVNNRPDPQTAVAPGSPTTAPVQSATQTSAVPDEVSVQDTAQKLEAGAFILDVREPDEWQAAHIEGATLIPLGELANRISEVPQDQEVVVVCRSGRRSAQGRDILREAGLANVSSMAGGMNEWQAAGLPVATGN